MTQMTVPSVSDFQVTGRGDNPAWARARWAPINRLAGPGSYATRCKVLYSPKGIYVLFDCEDRTLTCSKAKDFDDIYNEDVVEFFLWPDERQDLYFEYEISPLGVELPILVANHNGSFMGWRPWHYEGDRRTRKATHVRGGPAEPHANVEGWSAEVFVPFALFQGLGNTPPRPGARWRANFYRIDYDVKPQTYWAWSPLSKPNYHLFHEFGALVFE